MIYTATIVVVFSYLFLGYFLYRSIKRIEFLENYILALKNPVAASVATAMENRTKKTSPDKNFKYQNMIAKGTATTKDLKFVGTGPLE